MDSLVIGDAILGMLSDIVHAVDVVVSHVPFGD